MAGFVGVAKVIEWMPLFQTLVWPVFIAVFLVWQRGVVLTVLRSIAERVSSGAPFEIGSSGLKLGPIQTPPRASAPQALRTKGEIGHLPNPIYMSHWAVRAPSLDTHALTYYKLRIYLDADEVELLRKVTKVIYHLHPTFEEPDRTSAERTKDFELWIAAWGEFNMSAEIFFDDGKKLEVERYINFLRPST